MNALLVIISVLFVLVGSLSLSAATSGVGMVCVGIAFGVWARLHQAADHRREDRREANPGAPLPENRLAGLFKGGADDGPDARRAN